MKVVFFVILAVLFSALFQYFDIGLFLGIFNSSILAPLAVLIEMLRQFVDIFFSFYYLKLIFFVCVFALIIRFVLSWIGGEK